MKKGLSLWLHTVHSLHDEVKPWLEHRAAALAPPKQPQAALHAMECLQWVHRGESAEMYLGDLLFCMCVFARASLYLPGRGCCMCSILCVSVYVDYLWPVFDVLAIMCLFYSSRGSPANWSWNTRQTLVLWHKSEAGSGRDASLLSLVVVVVLMFLLSCRSIQQS